MDAPGKVPDSINCHSCGAVLDLAGQTGFKHVECRHCGAPSVVPLKFGDFLLLNMIGTGGTGTVYKAIDLVLNRYVALKVLRQNLLTDPAFVASFSGEARAAASVNHPNVPQVYSSGQIDNQHYMALELCDRGSLDDRITKLGRLPEPEALSIGLQIASALRVAWQHGMLHHDVKPGNILFNEDGVPKIMDFGLARGASQGSEGGSEPTSERIWGTPYYVAPEKLRGRPEDVRSDIYSLGATLFHAMTGHPPADSTKGAGGAGKPGFKPAASLKTDAPTVHDHTIAVIARMLARDPSARYGSYDEVIENLAEAQEILRAPHAGRPARSRQVAALFLLGTTILCVGVVWFVWKYGVAVFHGPQPSASATSPRAATTNAPPQKRQLEK